MTDFEDVDTADAPEVMGKLASLKITWDPKDINWWFSELKMQMTLLNIQSQWIERVNLSNNLPDDVRGEVKDILKKPKSQAPALVYKVLKGKVLKLFGPREGQRFEEASQLVLTGKPSALAKRITELLCQCDTPLQQPAAAPAPAAAAAAAAPAAVPKACCSAEIISALWRRQLPQQVRTRIAGMSLKAEYEAILQLADDTYATLGGAVAAVEEVSAVGRGRDRGRGRGRSRGRGRGASQRGAARSAQPQRETAASNNPADRHADGPPHSTDHAVWKA